MRDDECIRFLRWCLPRLGLRWRGFRKVRRTVCKRIARRLRELAVPDLEGYRAVLERNPEEWRRLAAFCRIPISRFYRDRGVFDALGRAILPQLAEAARRRGEAAVRAWCAGCASGEETYTLTILWRLGLGTAPQRPRLRVLATDADEVLIGRAREGRYGKGSLKEVPPEWLATAFVREGEEFCVRDEFREDVEFRRQDLGKDMPDGPFHLILCRNLAFTYFDEAAAARVLRGIGERLLAGGVLVIGSHERLPGEGGPLASLLSPLPIFRKAGEEAAGGGA